MFHVKRFSAAGIGQNLQNTIRKEPEVLRGKVECIGKRNLASFRFRLTAPCSTVFFQVQAENFGG